MLLISLLFLLFPVALFGRDFWEQHDVPFVGSVQSLAITHSGYVVVGKDSGIYYSKDSGNTWVRTSSITVVPPVSWSILREKK